ncbi:hypothetical protein HYR99_20290 [Candidatus Poribacteria bacterium]|nr:hypothetical protein [Candidatus Poribacteria bacterium]
MAIYVCVNAECPQNGYGFEDQDGQTIPCPECGETMIDERRRLQDVTLQVVSPVRVAGRRATTEPADAVIEDLCIASTPPYAGHQLMFGDHDETGEPPERVYTGQVIRRDPADPSANNDNGHVQRLKQDLLRLGYYGHRSPIPPKELFEIKVLGGVLALRADLKFRYGVSTVPYDPPARPEGIQEWRERWIGHWETHLASSVEAALKFFQPNVAGIGRQWRQVHQNATRLARRRIPNARERGAAFEQVLNRLRVNAEGETPLADTFSRLATEVAAAPPLTSSPANLSSLPESATPEIKRYMSSFILVNRGRTQDPLLAVADEIREEVALLKSTLDGVDDTELRALFQNVED